MPKDYPARVAADFPELLKIVEETVKPERLLNNDSTARRYWWRFLRPRGELYHAIGRGHAFARHPEGWDSGGAKFDRVITCSLVSKHLAFAFRPSGEVFAHRLAVFALGKLSDFGLMQSSFNEVWARKNSSSLETRLNYSPSDAYETLSMPPGDRSSLHEPAAAYDVQRSLIMRTEGIGLTDLYNRLHDPTDQSRAFAELRDLQRRLDVAVRDAYGWHDLDLAHGFHEVAYLPENDRVRFTISEVARLEVLRRLARLNRERWEAEQREAAAMAVKEPAAGYRAKRKGGRRSKAAGSGQAGLPFGAAED